MQQIFQRTVKIGTCNRWRNHLRKYESKKIKKLFGDPAASEGNGGGAPAVKSEPVFENEHEDVYQSTSSRDRGGNTEVDLK